jgi:hypothetical protein
MKRAIQCAVVRINNLDLRGVARPERSRPASAAICDGATHSDFRRMSRRAPLERRWHAAVVGDRGAAKTRQEFFEECFERAGAGETRQGSLADRTRAWKDEPAVSPGE